MPDVLHETESGGTFWDRPVLQGIIQRIKAGDITEFVTLDVDRLTRNQSHLGIFLDVLERHGCTLVFALYDFENTAIGKFMLNSRAFAAEFEREKIRYRTQDGLRERARKDGKLLGGWHYYGTRYADPETRRKGRSKLVEYEPEAATVREIFEALANRGSSATGIARDLTERGIPTPRGGREWTARQVINMVRNRAYLGEAVVFRASEPVTLPAGTIPALVDGDTFRRANEQLDRLRTHKEGTRNNRNPQAFLLRDGFARCALCDSLLVCSNTTGPRYVQAMQYRRQHDCPHVGIRAEDLDAAVWDRVTLLLSDPNILKSALLDQTADDTVDERIKDVERQLSKIEKAQRNQMRLAEEADDDDTFAMAKARLKDLAGQRAACLTMIAELESQRAGRKEVESFLDRLVARQTRIEALTYDEKRALLRELAVTARVYPEGHAERIIVDMRFDLSQWEAEAADTEPWPESSLIPFNRQGKAGAIPCNTR